MAGENDRGDTAVENVAGQPDPLSDEVVSHTFDEICEWCKQPVLVMCQKGTGVCSQQCAKFASHTLYSSKEKADKFRGGWDGSVEEGAADAAPPG